jgi:CO dehydrogenase maturation factor
MIIGFLGKGGSGKSTLSSAFANYLAEEGHQVLAIDADHNMDLSFNLGGPESMEYIGQGLPDILAHAGVKGYREIFGLKEPPRFSIAPTDPIVGKYSVALPNGVRLMSTGPHTENILYDKSCSHSLVTPLKVLLPFLNLSPKERVVIDEKAGTDSVGTGVTTGFTFAVVVSEPTPHGMKAARQIAELLTFYGTPYALALNKARSDSDIQAFSEAMGRSPDVVFRFHEGLSRIESSGRSDHKDALDALHRMASSVPDDRERRTREKFERNSEFASA